MQINRRRWKNDNDFIEHLIHLLGTMPDGHPAAFHQLSFSVVIKAGRTSTDDIISKTTTGWGDLSVEVASFILEKVWSRSVTLGASVYAALTRSFDAPPNTFPQVDYDYAWQGVEDRMNEENEESISFYAALHQLGSIEIIQEQMAINVLSQLMDIPFIQENKDILWAITKRNVMYGIASEASYVHCIEEKRQFNSVLIDFLQDTIEPSLELEDPNFEQKICKAFGKLVTNSPDIYPWPKDEICKCGKSLKPFIFCCDPHSPIHMNQYVEQLTPDFEIQCEYCGVSLPGFKCDFCGRVYTWQKGVVESID